MSGQSLSTLLQFRRSPLKLGFILALAAWLMQLSVFLTPIFAKQISVGFGVCEELAVFSQFKTTSTKPLSASSSHSSSPAAPHEDDMSGMSMAEMQDMPDMRMMQNPHSAHSPHQISNRALNDVSHETTRSTTSKSILTSSKSLTNTLLNPHAEPNHQHHAQCEFCLLLGHSVLPPLHVVIAVLLTLVIAKMMVKAKTTDALFLNQNKNLRPQGRAPPLFIS